MVNQRFERVIKVIIVVILTVMIVFTTSGCWNRGYRGNYSDLFTVAINSLLGTTGLCVLHRTPDPTIIVIEEDDYGRVLFFYNEGGDISTFNFLISQKSSEEYVYFYPHYNFISFRYLTEIIGDRRFSVIERGDVPPEILEELKIMNDWNQELNLDKAVRIRIVTRKEDGPINRRKLEEAFGVALGDGVERNPLCGWFEFMTTDAYGRSVYLGTHRESVEESGERDWRMRRVRYAVMLFQPDGSFDEVNGVMELVDTQNYQTALREFKELNGWNQPFEGSTSITLWLILGLVVIIGAGGFMVIRLYLKKKVAKIGSKPGDSI